MFKTNLQKTVIEVYEKNIREPQAENFGLELELEGRGFPDAPKGWRMTEDASLRGGVEYVLNKAYSKKGVENRVEALNKAFTDIGTRIQNSYRAGTHIHYNVQRQSFETVLGVIILFTILEPILLKLCGDERNGSYFCLPTYDAGDFDYFESLLDIIKRGKWGNFQNRGKYANLNTDPLISFGSVEFRSFPASHNTKEIVTWCTWIENIFNTVLNEKDKSFRTLYRKFKDQGISEVYKIFEGVDVQRACLPQHVSDLVAFGCEQAYEYLKMYRKFYNEPEKEVKEEKKKEFNYEIDGAAVGGGIAWAQDVNEFLIPDGIPELREAPAPNRNLFRPARIRAR